MTKLESGDSSPDRTWRVKHSYGLLADGILDPDPMIRETARSRIDRLTYALLRIRMLEHTRLAFQRCGADMRMYDRLWHEAGNRSAWAVARYVGQRMYGVRPLVFGTTGELRDWLLERGFGKRDPRLTPDSLDGFASMWSQDAQAGYPMVVPDMGVLLAAFRGDQ